MLHALRWCLADPDGNSINTGLVRDPKTKQIQMVGIDWGLANYPSLVGQHALIEDEKGKVGCDALEQVLDEKAQLRLGQEQEQLRLEQAFDVSLDSVIGIDAETLKQKPGLFNEVKGESYQVLHSLFSDWDYAKLKNDQASQLKQDIFKTLNDFVRIASIVQFDIDVYTQNVRSARSAFRCVKGFINDRVMALQTVKNQVRRKGLHSPTSVDEVEKFEQEGALKSYQSRLTMFSQAITRDAVLAQESINKKDSIIFLKTHSYLFNINNNPFTDLNNSLGAIYIVRDPRNLVTSYAHHFNISVEKASERMVNSIEYGGNLNSKYESDRTKVYLGSWSSNYDSWKSFKLAEKYLLIKYEDLLKNTESTLIKILDFIYRLRGVKFNQDHEKIKNIIDTTSFHYMRNLEKKKSFIESRINNTTGKKIPFFNLGPQNDSRKLLDEKIKLKLETSFKKQMEELHYL